MKIIPLLLTCAACCCCAQVSNAANTTNVVSLTLAWDWPLAADDGLTNYTFTVHCTNGLPPFTFATTNLGNPVWPDNAVRTLPWPVLVEVPNTTRVLVTLPMAAGDAAFFYVTARYMHSSQFDYADESNPSDAIRFRLLPNGFLSIQRDEAVAAVKTK